MSEPTDRAPPASGDPAALLGPGAVAPDPAASAHTAPRVRAVERAGLSRLLWVGIAMVALVAAVAVWLDAKHAQQALRTDVAQRLAGVEASVQASGKAQTQLATDLRDTQAKVTLLEARIAESQTQQAALEALYRDLAPSRDEIALSELEQMLLVANQQLAVRSAAPRVVARHGPAQSRTVFRRRRGEPEA